MTGVLPDPCESPSWQYLERAAPYVAGGRRLKPRKWATRVSCPPTSVRSSPRRSRIHCVHNSSCALRRYKNVASRIDESIDARCGRPTSAPFGSFIGTGYRLDTAEASPASASLVRQPPQHAAPRRWPAGWSPCVKFGSLTFSLVEAVNILIAAVITLIVAWSKCGGYVGGFPTAATAILAFSHTWDEYGHGPRVSDDR